MLSRDLHRLMVLIAMLVFSNPRVGSCLVDTPKWWRETRSIYCPFAASGAGSALLKFPSDDIHSRIKSFEELPELLDDARKLGSNVVYLVDWWEGGYEMKGNYEPYAKFGGPEAFRKGIQGVHKKGGRIILYLEAFIISRKSAIAQEKGKEWAMMDKDGNYYPYYLTGERFYLMYPGKGSGWTKYISDKAKELVQKYRIDGVHLDSYGYQWDWVDYNPLHPEGRNPESFNCGAVELVREVRRKMRAVKPDCIVMLEGNEFPELLDVCDGAQCESLDILLKKTWHCQQYKIFTSDFALSEMRRILDSGYCVSLTPYWFAAMPSETEFERMKRPIPRKGWYDRIKKLHHWDNILYANGISPPPQAVDLRKLRTIIEWKSYRIKPAEEYESAHYSRTVDAYHSALHRLLERTYILPADALRAMVLQAETWDDIR
mgnify:CR=1 FL=1